MLCKSFPQFPGLPAELRFYIWRLALRQPRVHRLRLTTPDLDEPLVLQPTETLSRSTVTGRTIPATCQESRAEALRVLPNEVPVGRSILHFDAREAVICLVQLNESILATVDANAAYYMAGELTTDNGQAPAEMKSSLTGLKQVRSLALQARHTSLQSSAFGFSLNNGLDHLAQFIALFSKLESLFLVALPTPDDMERVEGGHDDSDDDEDYIDNDANEEPKDEENKTYVISRNPSGGDVISFCGDWIRGENGLCDWYRWVSDPTEWIFADENFEVHFAGMFTCRKFVQDAFRFSDWADLSVENPQVVRSVQVRVMMHFRKGAEQLYDWWISENRN